MQAPQLAGAAALPLLPFSTFRFEVCVHWGSPKFMVFDLCEICSGRPLVASPGQPFHQHPSAASGHQDDMGPGPAAPLQRQLSGGTGI